MQEWFNSFEEFKFLLIKSEGKYKYEYNAITRHAKQDLLMWAFHKINDDPEKSVSNTWEAVI